MRNGEVRGACGVRIALAACLLLGAGLGSAASAGTTYRLVPPSFLDVGNQWVYHGHMTLNDNVPGDWSDTMTWEITGSQTVAGYPTSVLQESWASDGDLNWTYLDLTNDHLRKIRDEDDEHITEVTGNDPTEEIPVWCSDTDNQLHFGHGQYRGWEIADPTDTWTWIEDDRITFLARENVTVGAGTFLCTKGLRREDWIDDGGSYGYAENTAWIHADLGIIRRDVVEWEWDEGDQASYESHYSLTLNSTNVETVSVPTAIAGPTTGTPGQSLGFTASGSSSNKGHTIQYRFDWGDGNVSSWSSLAQNHAYTAVGTYQVKAQARSAGHKNVQSLWSGTLRTVTVAAPVIVTLANGWPVTGISGSAGSERFYSITVPEGQGELRIQNSGGTGECDMYVKCGSLPTTSSYDYRPYLTGNNETVTVSGPAAATWYIMLRGRAAYSGVSLQATYMVVLSNGLRVTDLSGSTGSRRYYSLAVPAGQGELRIQTWGGTGDCDMYVKRGSVPTTTSYDYRPYLTGNNETVTVSGPAAATWYIMLRGRAAYSGVSLQATYMVVLSNGVAKTGLSGSTASRRYYRLAVPAGQGQLKVQTWGGTGDCDMYVKCGSVPTTSIYDYRPYLAGNNETVTVSNPAAANWYIMLRGREAYSGVSLRATYSTGVGAASEQAAPLIGGAVQAAEALGILATPDRGPAPLDVLLEATGVAPATACAWDFGDGTTGTGNAAVHTYASPGTYTVTLTAGGKTATATVVVTE